MSDNHKYRVTVYLGKELHDKLQEMAEFLGIPLSTTTKLLLNTGVEFSKALEQKTLQGMERKEDKEVNGEQ